jgi:cell division protein FtsB
MARRSGQSGEVDIFNLSFLDVIACTVGALIFVLLMFMINASQVVVQASSPKREEDLLKSISDIESGRDELKILDGKLAAARNQKEEMGLGKDVTPEKLQAENESLKNEIARLADEVKDLENKASQTQNAPLGIWVEVLESRDSLKRRPHLVECRQDGIYIFEEKISETLERIRENTSRWNALRQRVEDSGENQYILFLVRPDGISTFSRLRSQLKRLEISHGYEPVLSDWRILGSWEPDRGISE